MLTREKAVLTVIDVQERILPVMQDVDAVIEGIRRLVLGFRILRAPILVTEQYSKGIGATDPRVIDALDGQDPLAAAVPAGLSIPPEDPANRYAPMDKMSFSCALHPPYMERLLALGSREVVICGVESHVCVLQTAVHLAQTGFEVHLAADAVSSRNAFHKDTAIRRMAQEGVKITNVETVIFEMLETCGTPQFKAWSRLIR